MRKLNEQWIEGGRMYKAVLDNKNLGLAEKIGYDEESKHLIWKIDLGLVNSEGCLAMPCDKNVFPEIEKVNNSVWFAKAQSGTVYMESWGIGRKGAVDSWNRRHA